MPKMPHARKWQPILTGYYDLQTAEILLARAQTFYDHYRSQPGADQHPAQKQTLNIRVLPGLSIYKALLAENDDREKVLSEVDSLFRATFFTMMIRGIGLLNKLPDPFPIVRPVLRSMAAGLDPAGAQHIVEDSNDCIAFNVFDCFIHDTLTAHEVPELTALFCSTDDWLSAALTKVRWERTKTLGRGADCCDFRWCRGPR